MFDLPKLQSDFSRSAVSYDEHALLQKSVRASTLELARRIWTASATLVDLGCGTGALAHEIRAQGLSWRLLGIDMAQGMCHKAQAQRMPSLCARADALPLPGGRFDGVFSSLMLQWCERPVDVFKEAARVITTGGYMVCSTLAQGTLAELGAAFAAVDDYPHLSSFPAAHEWLRQAELAGFELRQARQVKMVEYYTDVIGLMRSLQAIGATNKHQKRRKSLMTPKQFSRMERSYETQFATARGLPASWQVLYMVLRRP